MQRCEPGDRACENQRRYFQTNYERINSYHDQTQNINKPTDSSSLNTEAIPKRKKDELHRSGAIRISQPLKPSINDLSQEQINKAKMVKASRIAFNDGFDAAQSYLDKEGIPYDIDVELSSKESLVLLGDDGVKIAYRGTEIQNVSDVSADAMIAAGVEEHHPQFRNAEEQLALVREKYGMPNELLGYSLGGNKAMTMGNLQSIDTTTFNPFLGKNLLKSNSEVTHNILRTTEDFASLGVGLASSKENWKVSSILPHQDKLNPVEAHKLSNFTEVSKRRPGNTEVLLNSVHRAGKKAGELELMHAIKTAQENGQSFTEFVHDFNSGTGQDTSADGTRLAGTRMHRDSKWVKYWEEAKAVGSSQSAFTPEEEAYFKSIPKSKSVYDPAIRPKERAEFHTKSAAERTKAITKAHEQLQSVADAVNVHTEPYKASADVLKRAVHPTNLITGLGGGIAAHAVMDELIDKDHKIGETSRTGIEGATAGVLSEMGAAALAGTALTASGTGIAAVAGGASYLAGTKTSEGVSKGLQGLGVDHEASEGIGSATGGAVGGGVAAGTAIGGAALLGAEIGELGGPLGVAAGAAVGSVIGTAGWLVGKMFA